MWNRDPARAGPVADPRGLRLVDGTTLRGRAVGIADDGVLRFETEGPEPAVRDVAMDRVEPLSLRDALERLADPADGRALLRLAGILAERGLAELALHDLDRAESADPSLSRRVRRARARVCAGSARRRLAEARRLADAGRHAHARAALEDALRFRSHGREGREARALLRALAG